VRTADGSITVLAYGVLTASSVSSLQNRDTNDVTLRTRKAFDPSGPAPVLDANIVVGTVAAGTLGDVVLDATGAILAGATAITADSLSIVTRGAVGSSLTRLRTTVVSLSLLVDQPGSAWIAESNDLSITSARILTARCS